MTQTARRQYFKVRNGLDLRFGNPPPAELSESRTPRACGLLGRDYPGTRFDLVVETGSRVTAGEPIMQDRHRPGIVFPSPASGVVSAVTRGARRSVVSVVVHRDDDEKPVELDVPPEPEKHAVRRLMRESGLWTALRRRPYGAIPDPDGEPRALLVTAIDTQPLAPDPANVISRHRELFACGVEALTTICAAPVYVCQRPQSDLLDETATRAVIACFDGPHPAGLAGTHIHALHPIGFDRTEVWHLGYQDVISLGYLMSTGVAWMQREISLAGPGLSNPRMLAVPLGADLADLLAAEIETPPVEIISGSVLAGDVASGPTSFLGRRHHQVTVVPAATDNADSVTLAPGPFVPLPDLERVAPAGILAVPLLRALLVGDVEQARALGALELVEEDVALLSYVCASGTHYGGLLRGVLDQLEKEAA